MEFLEIFFFLILKDCKIFITDPVVVRPVTTKNILPYLMIYILKFQSKTRSFKLRPYNFFKRFSFIADRSVNCHFWSIIHVLVTWKPYKFMDDVKRWIYIRGVSFRNVALVEPKISTMAESSCEILKYIFSHQSYVIYV